MTFMYILDNMNEVKIEYTEAMEIVNGSSLVEGIFYNANDKTAVFDLQNRIYRYQNVSRLEVAQVATADSPGQAYQRFKRRFGPSESLGDYEEILWSKVPIKTNTVVGTISSNAMVGGSVGGTTGNATATTITFPDLRNSLKRFTVGFIVVPPAGTPLVDVKYYSLYARSEDDALMQTGQLADMLGLQFKIKEITRHFE